MSGPQRTYTARWAFGPADDLDDLTFHEKVNQMGDLRPLTPGTRLRAVPLIPMRLQRTFSSPSPTHPDGVVVAHVAAGEGEEHLEHTGRPTSAGSMPAAVDTALPRQGPVEAAGVLDPTHDTAAGRNRRRVYNSAP